jgi:hypothetical protein
VGLAAPAPPKVGSNTGAVVVGDGESLFAGGFRHRAGASVRPVTPFPASASSNAACGFPALRFPARFTPRVMGPIALGALSAAVSYNRCLLHLFQPKPFRFRANPQKR